MAVEGFEMVYVGCNLGLIILMEGKTNLSDSQCSSVNCEIFKELYRANGATMNIT